MTDNLPDPHDESQDGDSLTLAEHIDVADDLMADVQDETDPAEQRFLLETALEHYEEAEDRLGRVTRTLTEALRAAPDETDEEGR